MRSGTFAAFVLLTSVSAFFVPPGRLSAAPEAAFLRGDPSADGAIDITDPIRILDFLFLGASTPGCLDAADANDSGGIDLSDPVFLLGFLFQGGRAVPSPYPACGADPTADDLACEVYGGGPCGVLARLAGATALSNHYVQVEYEAPVPGQLFESTRYSIEGLAGGALEVLEARQDLDDPRRVLLATSAQEVTQYRLTIEGADGPGGPRPGGGQANGPGGSIVFQGSDDGEPRPISAISLGSTPTEGQVLVTYSEPMQEGLLDVRFLKISAPDLEIRSIQQAGIGVLTTTVILTTDPQRNVLYTLKVTNVKSKAGAFVVDPTRNTVTFYGVPPVDTTPPEVLSAVPTGNTSLTISFSEPLRPGSEDPRNFVIHCFDPFTNSACADLAIQSAELTALGTQVILNTLPQSPGMQYTVEVLNRCGSPPDRDNCVQDLQENPIGTTGNTAAFTGLDRDRPYLASAISLGPDPADDTKAYLLLTFSEPVLDGAENIAFYSITNPDLDLFDADLSLDGLTVTLTTEAQDAKAYTVKATNILSRAGGFALDPARNAATFTGIPPVDTVLPTVTGAVSTGSTSVVVSFSEPLLPGAGDPSNFVITCNDPVAGAACPDLVVTGASLSNHGTQVVLQTVPQIAFADYTVEVLDRCAEAPDACVKDLQENPIDPAGNSAAFVFNGRPLFSDALPRVVGAISTSNTTVVITFSKPMGSSAINPANYFIVQVNVNPEVGYLIVQSARFLDPDGTSVELTTFSQNEVTYSITAVNVRDLAGSQLEPPVVINGILVSPAEVQFPGTPPSADTLIDSDGDGLTDSEEQRGYIVRIQLYTGETIFREVTSNPLIPDTDADDIDDREEKRRNSDPRSADTDFDRLSDYEELNVLYSGMSDQDSDNDGVDDQDEVDLFKTNLLIADSDGDGFTDAQEIYDLARDPRIADLPRQGILIGDMTLRLDERFSFTDEDGQTVSESSNTSVTVNQGTTSTLSRSDQQVHSFMVQGEVKGGLSDQAADLKFIQGTLTLSNNNEYTSSVSRETAQSMERAFAESLDKGREISGSSSVTREVVGAAIEVNVSLQNLSDVALSIRNVEITALVTDPRDRTRLLPLATLIPKSTLLTGTEAVFHLGPFDPARGPIIFASIEAYPSLVEDLMKNPRGIVFKVSNYDLTDEFDRNFAFASQTARDRTTGILIDFGDGTVERYLVGTGAALNWPRDETRCASGPRYGEPCASGADCSGAPCEPGAIVGGMANFPGTGTQLGIPLEFALRDILGMKKNSTENDGILAGPDRVVQSFARGDDVQIVPSGVDGVPADTIAILAGPNGVLDTTPQGDDVAAVVTGYETSASCGSSTPAFIVDGGDGVASTAKEGDDVQLVAVGGSVAPGGHIIGPGTNGVIDTVPKGPNNDDVFMGPGLACAGAGDCPGGACDGPEVLVRIKNRKLGQFGRTWKIIVPRLPAEAAADDAKVSTDFGSIMLRPGETIGFAFVRDRDRDGLIAQEEFMFGSRDDLQDTDGDGLDDFAEVKIGWEVSVDGGTGRRVFSDPGSPDSDNDGLDDFEESDLRSIVTASDYGQPDDQPFSTDPRLADTDDDLVSDNDEIRGYLIGNAIAEPKNVIIAGDDGVADTRACGSATSGCDDLQVVPIGSRGHKRRVVVAPGPDGVLHSSTLAHAGFVKDTQVSTGNGKADTAAAGDDRQIIAVGQTAAGGAAIIKPGANGFFESAPQVDDVIQGGNKIVKTDPLSRDFDADSIFDGRERLLGTDPTDPKDGNNFTDIDDDGLTDSEEESVGWKVTVTDVAGTTSERTVFSNPNTGDSDFDGLPDLVERSLGTDPTSPDTDGDSLPDFDEASEDTFNRFAALISVYTGFSLDGSSSALLGTSPRKVDTDGDGLADDVELTGYVIKVVGGGATKRVLTDPLDPDTDDDFLGDKQESVLKSDATVADTDGDGRVDGVECCPVTSEGQTATTACNPATTAACESGQVRSSDSVTVAGSNPLVPELRVTVTFARLTATWGGLGAEWWWNFYVHKSDESFPGVRVSDPAAANPNGSCPTIAEDNGFDPECNWCAQADLLNNVLRNSRTMVLKPGQGFVLHGVIAELHWNADGISSCDRAKNNNPRLGNGDDDQCSMSLPVAAYSYEDLVGRGFIAQELQFEKGISNNTANCEGSVLVEIQVQ